MKWRARARAAWAILAGLIAFLIVPGTLGSRTAAALLVALVLFIAITRYARRGNRNPGLLDFYRERLGGNGPFVCSVEITETGIVARRLGPESRRPWSQVASVSEVQGGIEFFYKPMGSLLVSDRSFPDAQARIAFLALARKLRLAKA